MSQNLLVKIMVAGLFVYLFQMHPLEKFVLNLEVVAMALGKGTKEAAPL